MALAQSYKRNGALHRTNETLADSFAQPFLKPISKGHTNNTSESEAVASNYIWSVRLEHATMYMKQEVDLYLQLHRIAIECDLLSSLGGVKKASLIFPCESSCLLRGVPLPPYTHTRLLT